jgi:hypothetical protein
MKTVKAKKLVLDNALLEEEFFEDIALIGIVSALDFHTFIWTINSYLNTSFARNHASEINLQDVFFPVFSFEENLALVEHYIFCNRNKTNFLLPEAKNVDYIWMIKTTFNKTNCIAKYLQHLPSIQAVNYCFEIAPNSIKNKQHLII